MNPCPICQSPMCQYNYDGVQCICWNCGHYESDSQAYREYPKLFENMVQENPAYFLKKFLKLKLSDESLQRNPSDGDFTEPIKRILY